MEFSRFYGGSNVLNGGSNGISWDPLVKPLQKKHGTSPCVTGTCTISMAIVNGYVKVPEG